MDGFQSKPVNMDKLRRVIRSAVADQTVEIVASALMTPDEPKGADVEGTRELDLVAFDARRAELVDVLGEEDFQELLASFFDDVRVALTELGTCLATGDKDRVDRLLHTVKGAAGNVGLEPVALLAQALRESTFDGGGLQTLSSTVDGFAKRLAA